MYNIETQSQPTMYFIGVSTSQSSIMRVFPLWMKELGRPEIRLQGADLKLHDEPGRYRQAVAQIKYDPLSLGALVTSHKISLLEAARDMFDYLDPHATMCGEVSSVSKSGAALEGHAMDPISAGLSLDSLLGAGYFGPNRADVLCLGAGGAATAIVLHFVHKPDAADRPRRMVIVNRSAGRLETLQKMVGALKTDIEFDYRLNARPEVNDGLMAALPPGSLVINGTGMGKDLPGSPVTGAGWFPLNGVAWELNYRGELAFLRYALDQHESRGLVVEDGWLYFLHGWTQVIAQVLKTRIEGPLFDRLASIASAICSPALPGRAVPERLREASRPLKLGNARLR
jgi:shikimate 5-dehydrogenase